MTQDPYAEVAELVDLLRGGFGHSNPERAGFFRALFGENQVRTVLDCACGTGHDVYLLHSLGYQVVGSDVSEVMLRQARKNLAERGASVALPEVDYRHLPQHFTQLFDSVICMTSSILEMPDDEQALTAFQSMRAVLRPGGLLVLDQGTSDKQWRERTRFSLGTNNSDVSQVFVIDYLDYDKRNARYHVLTVFHGEESSSLKLWSRDLHVLLKDDQERLLVAAGFQAIAFYGNFLRDPYDKQRSSRLITVARK